MKAIISPIQDSNIENPHIKEFSMVLITEEVEQQIKLAGKIVERYNNIDMVRINNKLFRGFVLQRSIMFIGENDGGNIEGSDNRALYDSLLATFRDLIHTYEEGETTIVDLPDRVTNMFTTAEIQRYDDDAVELFVFRRKMLEDQQPLPYTGFCYRITNHHQQMFESFDYPIELFQKQAKYSLETKKNAIVFLENVNHEKDSLA